MKTYFDCIPCFLSQALRAARLVSGDPAMHERVLRNVLRKTAEIDFNQSPPAMGRWIYAMVKEIAGHEDPYQTIKQNFNAVALELLPEFRKIIACADDPFDAALRLAIAGNIIDFGVHGDIRPEDVRNILEDSLVRDLTGDVRAFQSAVERAERILYLGDNAGEIVFDRLFIEQMNPRKIIFGVRGAPVINDVTLEDARASGITDLVRVVANGSDAPGTLLDRCSAEFREIFTAADLVIAKGQGNYESLSGADQNIFFLFMVKCPVVAAHTGLPQGSRVIFHNPL